MEGAVRDEGRRTFHTLDLLRGLAAIVIVGRHLHGVLHHWLPGSHLAVDLFFVLSGFVIAHAYADRLEGGLTAGAFMRIRIIRLYPLYLLGSIIGVVVAGTTAMVGNPGSANVGDWVAAIALMLAFLPAPFFNDYQLFPFNGVAWSLLWELVANAVYAVAAPYLTRAWLIVGLAVGAALIVITAIRFDGLSSGSNVFDWIGGPQRVGYSFLAGIAAYRLWRAGRFPWLRLPPLVAAAILLAIFVLRPDGSAPVFDSIVVLAVFPLLVFAATAEPSPRLYTVSLKLGLASYGVYALHAPFAKVLEVALSRVGSITTPVRFAIDTSFILFILAFALVADRWFDRPVRTWLSRRGRLTANADAGRRTA